MGFLDAFGSNDPQSEAMRQGLLRMGLALMQAKGNPGQILGQAGTEGVNGMQSFQDRQFKQKLQQEALAEIARKKVIQGREDTAYQDSQNLSLLPSQFAKDATQMGNQATLAQTGNLNPTTSNAAIQSANAQPGFDYQGLINKYQSTKGGMPMALALQAAIKKDTTPISAGPGVTLVDPQTRKPFFTNPANPHADSPDIQALAQLYGKGTPEFNNALASMMDKKNHIVPQGFTRDDKGNLTVDPTWLRVQKELRSVGPEATAASRDSSTVQLTDYGRQAYSDLAKQGKLPAGFGRYGMADRNNFLNDAGAKAYGPGGTGISIAGEQASAVANKSALTSMQKDLTAIRPYKEMLDKNADIAIDLAGKVLKTNSALANKPITWIEQNLGNNPTVGEFMAQNHFVTTEAARVLSNPRLVGQMTDTAVKDMQSVVNGNAPLGTYARVLNRIKADGQNRIDAMQKEHDRLVGSFTPTTPRPAGLPSISDIEAELAKRK